MKPLPSLIKTLTVVNIQVSYPYKTRGEIVIVVVFIPIIIIIIISRRGLGFSRPVAASSNSLFKDIPSVQPPNYWNITSFKARLIYVIYKDSVCTSQRTQRAPNTRTSVLLLYLVPECSLFIANTQKCIL
jgi:hypothetical protein